MQCPSCGRHNLASAERCAGCAAPFPRRCPACGVALRAAARFCVACGRPADTSSPGAAAHPPLLPASFAGGRYRVARSLGVGGHKQVYLAHDTSLDRDVAVALISTDGLSAADLARIRREAQAMARLGDHPHVVSVHDIGEEGGRPYIVTQFMAGGDVDGLLEHAEGRRLPLDQVLRIGDQVCQALEHAHQHGIVHRDLKPSNVWLTGDGTAKLGDFGLAIATDQSRVTQAGTILGTIAYIAPEQAMGQPPDTRSDLYALGAMLYELVSGRPPFPGDDPLAVLYQHIHTAPVAPSWHNPAVPRPLEALILRLLAKLPEERPASAGEVREALAAIARAGSTTIERDRAWAAQLQGRANPLDRLAGGVFVGREQEVAVLQTGLQEALSGHGRLVLLVGEPGIGKTRTAEEFATYAQLRGAQVLWGRCHEGEGAPAYWPWVALIRAYVHDRDPDSLRAEMGPGAADIAQVVSAVRERLPELAVPPVSGGPHGGQSEETLPYPRGGESKGSPPYRDIGDPGLQVTPEQARFRLFDSITTFLANASSRQPLVLILDDLHWADAPSLLLLQFLARELRRTRLLVIGTYRDVQLNRQHPLAQTLAVLAREQHVERLVLRGLGEPDVSRFIELTSGRPPPPALAAAVSKETEGNPFFVTEVVRLLASDGRLHSAEAMHSWGGTIPQGVREAVGRRLDQLSADCNRALSLAAVIGREFGSDVLERVSGIAGERLLEVLEEATAARILAEVPRAAGRYSFTHALIRETLYGELSTARRVHLHRRVGEALEALWGANAGPHLAELAYHFFEAAPGGDVGKAIDYAVQAAERASSLLAYEEAAGHYERALQALELGTPDEAQRCELLLEVGDALNRAGDVSQAKGAFRRAAEVARALGPQVGAERAAALLTRAALGHGESGPVPGTVKATVDLLEEALRALGEGDSLLRARALGLLAENLAGSGTGKRRLALSAEAVAMARRLGDPATLAFALNERHWALWRPGNVEERLAVATEMIELAEPVKDRELAWKGHRWRMQDLLELGDIRAVDQEIDACARLAEELRQPVYLWHVATARAMRALMEGRFVDCERLAQQGLALGQRVQGTVAQQNYAAQLFILRREQGRIAELEPAVQGFADVPPAASVWRCALALLYSELGRAAEARVQFEHAAVNDFAGLPQDALWLTAITLLAEVCAYLGDGRRAETLYELLLPYAGRNIVIGRATVSSGSASRCLGLLAATAGRPQEAEQHFTAALAFNAHMGARPAVARTRQDYAVMLLARDHPGDREQALDMAVQAAAVAEELGMARLAERAAVIRRDAESLLKR